MKNLREENIRFEKYCQKLRFKSYCQVSLLMISELVPQIDFDHRRQNKQDHYDDIENSHDQENIAE